MVSRPAPPRRNANGRLGLKHILTIDRFQGMEHGFLYGLNLVVCLLCFFCLPIGCDHVLVLSDPIVGFGRYIKDAVTDQIIDSAWIDFDSLSPYYVFSDSAGYYIFSDFGKPPEDFHIFVGKQGYIVLETLINVPPDTPFLDSVIIYLEPIELIE